jgi:hypothetical protein
VDALAEVSRDVAIKLLCVLRDNPMTVNERIDALAMTCNAVFAMKREHPRLWERMTRATAVTPGHLQVGGPTE